MYKNQIASLYIDPKEVFTKNTVLKAARVLLTENFSKGVIDEDAFVKASEQLDSIEKGGEGSKGGHIIGHTSSGKPIYDQHDNEGHKGFTIQDHKDAGYVHSRKSDDHFDSHQSANRMARYHEKNGNSKSYSAYKKTSKEYHDASMKHAEEGEKHEKSAREAEAK